MSAGLADNESGSSSAVSKDSKENLRVRSFIPSETKSISDSLLLLLEARYPVNYPTMRLVWLWSALGVHRYRVNWRDYKTGFISKSLFVRAEIVDARVVIIDNK